MPQANRPMRVIAPRHGSARPAERINVGKRIEVRESPFGDGGTIYLSAGNPTDTLGYSPGDLWLNTETGTVFRLE